MQMALFKHIAKYFFPQRDVTLVKKKYHLPEIINLNFKFSQDGWFVVTSPDLPGFVTEAKNKDELIDMVNDAVLTYFDVPRRDADMVYDELKLGDNVIKYTGALMTRTA